MLQLLRVAEPEDQLATPGSCPQKPRMGLAASGSCHGEVCHAVQIAATPELSWWRIRVLAPQLDHMGSDPGFAIYKMCDFEHIIYSYGPQSRYL